MRAALPLHREVSVPVGTAPTATAFDPATHEIFAANYATNNVSVICDGSKVCGGASMRDKVVATVGVGTNPYGVAYDPTVREAFVTDDGSNDVTIFSGVSDSVVYITPVGSFPIGIAYDPVKGELWVANNGDNTVSVISGSTDSVVATIPVGLGPYGVAPDPGRDLIFVSNAYSNSVSVISDLTNTVVATIPVDESPTGIAYDSSTGQVWVACTLSNTTDIISPATETVVGGVVPSMGLPYGVVIDPRTHDVFVSNTGLDNVSVISDTTDVVRGTVAVGTFPEGLAYDSAVPGIYVADRDSNRVEVITALTPMVTTQVGIVFPYAVAYDAPKHEFFVTQAYEPCSTGYVYVFSDATDSLVASVPTTYCTTGATFDLTAHEVFVGDPGLDAVLAISDSTNTVVATIPVGSVPQWLTYDPPMHEVFVTNNNSDNVSVICDGSAVCGGLAQKDKVVASVPVGIDPQGVAYDAHTHEIFVANGYSQNVSVICDGAGSCGGSSARNKVVASIADPGGGGFPRIGPYGVAYDPVKQQVFVSDLFLNLVTVFDDTTYAIQANVPAGTSPEGLAYDASHREMFVTNYGSGNVSVICDGSTVCGGTTMTDAVVQTVVLGGAPIGVAWDTHAGDHKLYVAVSLSCIFCTGGHVAVISDTTPA